MKQQKFQDSFSNLTMTETDSYRTKIAQSTNNTDLLTGERLPQWWTELTWLQKSRPMHGSRLYLRS